MPVNPEALLVPEFGVAIFISEEAYKQFADVAFDFRCNPDQLAEFALRTFALEHSVIASAVRRAA